MTITYPTGAVREATLLSDVDEALKVVTSADGKVRTFTRLNDGEWYSEACEPVTIVFHTTIGI